MRRIWLVGLVALSGCVTNEGDKTALVSGNPFGQAPRLAASAPSTHVKGDAAISQRVSQLGQKIVEANPQLGFKPVFATIGSPKLELFHTDGPTPLTKDVARTPAAVVYITEGMVRRCGNDIDLSAVLSYELARVLAEREANVSPDIRNPERMPPIQVPIGNAGHTRELDFTNTVELAKFEAKYPKTARPVAPPDPRRVAATLLDKAGYPRNALDIVEPLLREADNNIALERGIKGGVSNWTPE